MGSEVGVFARDEGTPRYNSFKCKRSLMRTGKEAIMSVGHLRFRRRYSSDLSFVKRL